MLEFAILKPSYLDERMELITLGHHSGYDSGCLFLKGKENGARRKRVHNESDTAFQNASEADGVQQATEYKGDKHSHRQHASVIF